MHGRIKRHAAPAAPDPGSHRRASAVICPLCDRPVPQSERDAHHLVPKSRGGAETVVLHRICHRQIHALFSLSELERQYRSVEALREAPQLARFLAWVRRKPDDFFERTRKSQRLRGLRNALAGDR